METKQICHFFIDDSNVWIEAKKFAAKGNVNMPPLQGTGGKNEDPRLRIDLGRLIEVIAAGREIPADSSFLFGSRPPPNDSVWKKARQLGFTVDVFDRERGKPHGKEKEVDTAMVAAIIEQATELDVEARTNREKLEEKQRTVFVLVTGDRDMRPAVKGPLRKSIQVELWAWESGLSREFRKMSAQESLLEVRYLDSIYDQVTFTEFKSTRKGKIDARVALVLCDFTNRDEFTEWEWEQHICDDHLMQFHRLFYISWSPTGNELIVEFPEVSADVLDSLILQTRELFNGEISVIS
jgi:hypothetical protein